MHLTAGARLGAYEVATQLGVGGMGEVWKAHDTRLNRDVALKILPEAFASDPDRLARFKREAQVLASLNHPNIGAIYGIEESDGVQALVLELVDGPTLADRIARGPIPVAEALPLAKQIAEALEAAHEAGVIHRDLKPANIKVREDGPVKVLDFGLAKALQPDATDASVTASPTISLTAAATQMGMVIGTAAYMAPEQAKGRAVDKRADVWAFGAVLYEMLTGKGPFTGEDVSETLARVIDREPDWAILPPALPPALGIFLRRCLAKSPKQRIRDIGDIRLALEGVFEISSSGIETAAPTQQPAPAWRRMLPILGTAVAVGLAVGVAAWMLWPAPSPQPVNRFAYELTEGLTFRNRNRPVMAVSPDGRSVVYNTNQGLYLRTMGELEARLIPGTEENLSNPFFSPDGRSIAYWAQLGTQLKRIDISGGAPVVVADSLDNPWGASWGPDGTMLIAQTDGIYRVAATGGTPELVVSITEAERVHGPSLLPDGETVLFTLRNTAQDWDEARIVAQSLATGERTVLVEGGSDARYVSTGHLVYALEATLLGVAFDAETLRVTGGSVPLVQGVMRARGGAGTTAATAFGIADDGALIFVQGDAPRTESRLLALVDRAGTVTSLDAPPRPYVHPRLSPDGTQIAVATEDDQEIWIYDVRAGGALRQLTFRGDSHLPVWTPDGQYVTFQSGLNGDRAIFRQRADGSTVAERLSPDIPDGERHEPESWHPDGQTLTFNNIHGGDQGVWALSVEGTQPRSPVLVVDTPDVVDKHSVFSPDGAWLAYMTTEEGETRVRVEPFPQTGARYQLPERSRTPLWTPDGAELFFHVDDTNELKVVAVRTEPGFSFGVPVTLPVRNTIHPIQQRNYDVTPDGTQLLVVLPESDADVDVVAPVTVVVQNFLAELERLVPTQ